MDFAKKHLEKYGWEEGDGLGKAKDGIVTAIKPKFKFDSAGLGHNRRDEFTFHWWDHVYNSAASNIQVAPADDGTVVIEKGTQTVEVSSKKPSKKHRPKGSSYGNFCKAGVLSTNGKIVKDAEAIEELETDERKDFMTGLTDEEILKACGGRTAHKGARHGHRCTGKLNRVAQQEAALLERWQLEEATKLQTMATANKEIKRKSSNILPISQDIADSSPPENQLKPSKKKKKKQKIQEELVPEPLEEPASPGEVPKTKKKKKEKSMYKEERLE